MARYRAYLATTADRVVEFEYAPDPDSDDPEADLLEAAYAADQGVRGCHHCSGQFNLNDWEIRSDDDIEKIED